MQKRAAHLVVHASLEATGDQRAKALRGIEKEAAIAAVGRVGGAASEGVVDGSVELLEGLSALAGQHACDRENEPAANRRIQVSTFDGALERAGGDLDATRVLVPLQEVARHEDVPRAGEADHSEHRVSPSSFEAAGREKSLHLVESATQQIELRTHDAYVRDQREERHDVGLAFDRSEQRQHLVVPPLRVTQTRKHQHHPVATGGWLVRAELKRVLERVATDGALVHLVGRLSERGEERDRHRQHVPAATARDRERSFDVAPLRCRPVHQALEPAMAGLKDMW